MALLKPPPAQSSLGSDHMLTGARRCAKSVLSTDWLQEIESIVRDPEGEVRDPRSHSWQVLEGRLPTQL